VTAFSERLKQLVPQLHYVGAERSPVIVIDDFFSDPEAFVAMARTASFRAVGDNFYPGVRAMAPAAYAHDLVAQVEQLARTAFGMEDHALVGYECYFSMVTTAPAQMNLSQALPHCDTTNPNQLALVHYLCPPERGGTSFYRHRSTGFETVTAEREATYVARVNEDLKKFGPVKRGYIDGNTPIFERLMSVEARFNRLVVYRSIQLHSGNIAPGFVFTPDIDNGRLTGTAFIQFAEQSP